MASLIKLARVRAYARGPHPDEARKGPSEPRWGWKGAQGVSWTPPRPVQAFHRNRRRFGGYLKLAFPGEAVRRPLVLDTSALMAGRPLGPDEDTLVPAAVLGELRPGGRDRRHLDHLLAAGARIVEADPAARARVREEAKRGGEGPRLSEADVDVLAVALSLGAEVASDDYTLQNLARRLGVQVRGVQQAGISQEFRFVPRCTGCRRILDAPAQECPVCGSPVRMVRDRSFK